MSRCELDLLAAALNTPVGVPLDQTQYRHPFYGESVCCCRSIGIVTMISSIQRSRSYIEAIGEAPEIRAIFPEGDVKFGWIL